MSSKCLPGGTNGKESACQARGVGSIPGSGRSPGEGNGNPLQYSCLENPTDREAWQVAVHRVTKSWIQLKWLGTHTCTGLVRAAAELTPQGHGEVKRFLKWCPSSTHMPRSAWAAWWHRALSGLWTAQDRDDGSTTRGWLVFISGQ